VTWPREQRQQHDGYELGDRTGGDHQLPEVGAGLPGILEQRYQQPERGGHQRDPHQQRRRDRSTESGEIGERQRQHRRPAERDEGQAHRPAAEAFGVDLVPRDEEQQAQTKIEEHPDRGVDVHPAEPGRADDHPADDLQHQGRYEQGGRELQQQRDGDGDGDDEQSVEGQRGHRRPPIECAVRVVKGRDLLLGTAPSTTAPASHAQHAEQQGLRVCGKADRAARGRS